MKTFTKMLMMLALFVFGVSMQAVAEDDPITVTFRVNTSTVADTLSADGVLQIRGAVNGSEFSNEDYFGQNINWGSSSVQGQNIAGDYWEFNVLMAPGDQLAYKFWAGNDTENGIGFNDGWEFDPVGGGNYMFEVPEDADSDIVLPIEFFAGTDAGRTAPFEPSDEGFTAVHFRVNVGARVATSQYDPENPDHIVGVRGNYNQETGQVLYKYVIDTPDGVQWEDGADKTFFVPAADSTIRWTNFNNEVPPSGEVIEAEVEFRANVSLLEQLGYFNRGIGDRVAVPGAFNNWDSATSMTYDEGEDIWRSSFVLTREVGQQIPYKYFIIWDESRFDEDSPNFIPNLISGNGWEEPGAFGGGDRLYEFGSTPFQVATGDFGGDIGFFNSLPEQALITVEGTGSDTYTVTFPLDMAPALEHEDPFDPANDEVFLVVETPIFGLTQDLSVGDGQPGLDDPDQRDRLRFNRVGDTMMYELELEIALPTENHFGFRIAYGPEDGPYVINGGGFDAGRRYYRYIEPEAVIGEVTLWPAGGFTFDEITWKAEDLDFPAPPDYGLGEADAPVLFSDFPQLDWGQTFALTRETQPESNNHLYSGTVYFPTTPTSVQPGSELPRAITLSQNYPNPFNPTTNINFTLPESADIRLDVFNVLGQRVATLANGTFSAGVHTVQFDASRLSSGVYLYRLQSGSFTTQRTMMLVK
ncbi:Por secretion system C-terminal sorting domain-containing protein [Cyclonatronum proteinivorum]|uniref:Por secretion system C-terminal sorting domain-containing protein n=1 Tax=Cyclonatronum proteinivorum TaxID=1457365 RepID=A0A345UMP8_9BACT|nr:T9SS type A sorting domain-containing protein [Cyclonatronum proteinivorum]AXJ01750.1 Por secretion system C-terminal sorting domain-containing protein [Cyclonatronum proteinivorum]